MVYAVSATTSLDTMWSGFIGLFFMTAFVVLMISFMASSITTMRQIQPIREMAKATRRYAEGDFDIRMNDYGRDDELGELAASFNNMAENLQQTERQRREFIANISHELKTPMTTIAGYTDGILDGTIPPENERQYLQIISDESRRLSRLVRRMLDVSQLQAIDPLREGKHFDICESMRRVLISMEKKITDRNLDVEADIPEEPILVLGDKDMITQVIYNLLENATKFATGGLHSLSGRHHHRRQGPGDGAERGGHHPGRGAAAAVRAVPQERQVPQRGQGRLRPGAVHRQDHFGAAQGKDQCDQRGRRDHVLLLPGHGVRRAWRKKSSLAGEDRLSGEVVEVYRQPAARGGGGAVQPPPAGTALPPPGAAPPAAPDAGCGFSWSAWRWCWAWRRASWMWYLLPAGSSADPL